MNTQLSATELAKKICDRLGICYSCGDGSSTLQGVPIESVENLFPTVNDYAVSFAFDMKPSAYRKAPYQNRFTCKVKSHLYQIDVTSFEYSCAFANDPSAA